MKVNSRGVILDVDGTLVDSNDQHARSWCEVFERAGLKASYEVVRSLIGKGSDKLLPEAVGVNSESETGKRLETERGELFRKKYLPTIKPFPATRDLILKLQFVGWKLAIGSSAKKKDLEALLEIAQVSDLIPVGEGAEAAENSKPSPDIVKVALKQLGLPPSEVLMLGDTPWDIIAAKGAQVKAVAFECGGWKREALEGALAVFSDPKDLLARFEDSPFGGSRP